jgi:hypothetical protein
MLGTGKTVSILAGKPVQPMVKRWETHAKAEIEGFE